ncbi:hypothetical protein [Pedobacter mucosus]|uniref:hypothetical protein n=1 Tax=Pedobacter mucosus TaxID=2895286 RepID=UPI001EE3AC90|nr:hypothetical protein [Pedobacter mucosus]UKT65920.1 hypothetical protein LOK61_09030 [Pedobacter mucosus]
MVFKKNQDIIKMKYLTSIALILVTLFSYGQNFKTLEVFRNNDTIPSGKAIFYGSFIQRLGFTSGGFPQDIRLINTDTKEVFTFRVKPAYKSTKENNFFYVIKPGNYAILHYWWTQSKWYGSKFFTEPIFKGIDSKDDLIAKLKSGKIKESDLIRYSFTITENSLNYLGTWHFDSGLVSFTNDKKDMDNKVMEKYRNINLSTATINLPN